jgi:hypothetical protein
MIRLAVNPFDVRKWLEDCCHTNRLIGLREPDSNENAGWVAGEEHPLANLAEAYRDWQRSIKSPVAPQPTPTGSLGEIFGKCGFGRRRVTSGMRYTLPEADQCAARIWAKVT